MYPARPPLVAIPSIPTSMIAPSPPPQLLKLQHTLQLVLLACWRQQEAASPLDITRWALDGHLPYLAFAAAEGAGLAQYRNTIGPELLAAKGGGSGKWGSCTFLQDVHT